MADRDSTSTLMGMKVLNESRAKLESRYAKALVSLLQCYNGGAGAGNEDNTATHTLLSNFKPFVRIPAHNATLKPAPAPFNNAGYNLVLGVSEIGEVHSQHRSAREVRRGVVAHHRLGHA